MCLYILKPFHMVILRGEIGTVLDAIPPFVIRTTLVTCMSALPFGIFITFNKENYMYHVYCFM